MHFTGTGAPIFFWYDSDKNLKSHILAPHTSNHNFLSIHSFSPRKYIRSRLKPGRFKGQIFSYLPQNIHQKIEFCRQNPCQCQQQEFNFKFSANYLRKVILGMQSTNRLSLSLIDNTGSELHLTLPKKKPCDGINFLTNISSLCR